MQALARRVAAPVFTLALFSSAALIFVLQPLFGRLATPLLGGSPAVWNTSMAFFQAALLLGYLYAHLLARLKDIRLQAAIHVLVLLAAWTLLPVRVSELMGQPDSDHPTLWLLGVLMLSVGAPFTAAAATAPLLQAWFARTGRADAHDPYYLYAASNLGSFIGLLAYPVLIEPLMGVLAQSLAWTAAYGLVTVLIAVAGFTALCAHGAPAKLEEVAHGEAAPALTWRQRLHWIAAAAIPSSLSLGVTLHISTDVASAPFLWVLPLALYLATFVIAFMKGGERVTPLVLILHPIALAVTVLSYFSHDEWSLALLANLACFFLSALVCHLALARTRPPASRLTEFYLWISLGGVIGGGFTALAAPLIFNDVYEYPLALAAIALFRPRAPVAMPRLADTFAVGAVVMALVALALLRLDPPLAVIFAGAVGASGAIIAAVWPDKEDTHPAQRIAFVVAALILAGLMSYISFFNEALIVHGRVEGDTKSFTLQQSASVPILLTAFAVLAFCAHAAIQLRQKPSVIADIGLGVATPACLLLVAFMLMEDRLTTHVIIVIALGFAAVALFLNRARPLMLAGLVLVSFAIIFLNDTRGGRVIHQERSFFGVLRTESFDDPGDPSAPELRVLLHGTTIHGAQLFGPGLERRSLTYYNPGTALGEAILAGLSTGETSHLALIGLGAGSTACLMRPSDQLTIYEIDPVVVRLANSPQGYFTYVPQCQPNAKVELGDARLKIADAAEGTFDVILVDAFTSDAIPAHLLTREAIAMYLSKLSSRGILVLHLSNRNLALVSEAARVARELNAPTLWRVSDRVSDPIAGPYGGLPASAMVLARSPEVLARLPLQSTQWSVFAAPPGRAWSDDYINLPRALWESVNGAEECRTFPDTKRCVQQNNIKR